MSLLRNLFGRGSESRPRAEPPVAEAHHHARVHALFGVTAPDFLRKNDNVVLDLWAAWCRPCRAFSPVVELMAQRYDGKVSFGKVNIDRDPTLAQRWEVGSIPTLLFFRKGELVRRWEGLCSPQVLDRRIRHTFKI